MSNEFISSLEEIIENSSVEMDQFNSDIELLVKDFKNTDTPVTYGTLFGFIPKIESMRISIFELISSGEIY